MIIWKPFHHNGVTYDLTHLHPYWCAFGQEAKGDKPARKYDVNVIFSLHCFSRKLKAGEVLDDALAYSDSRETRHFDFRRYELSKLLPEIVRALPTVKCYHTGHGNFFTVRSVNPITGVPEDYEVYFAASRSTARPGALNLFVQSAYVRDAAHVESRPRRKPIGFFVVLYNTLTGRPIRTPQ